MAAGPTSGTARTRVDLLTNFFQDGQANNSITTQDMRDFVESVNQYGATAAAQMHSLTTQSAASADTPYSVALEVNTFKENVTHSETVSNEEITIDLDGVYEMTVNVTISQTSGSGAQVAVWLEEDTGGGWVALDTALRRDGSGNNALGFASLMHLDRHSVGDKYRIRWQTDNTNAQLTSVAAAGGVPAIPSVDVHIKKLGD